MSLLTDCMARAEKAEAQLSELHRKDFARTAEHNLLVQENRELRERAEKAEAAVRPSRSADRREPRVGT